MRTILLVIVYLLIAASCGEKRREKKAHAEDTTISQFKATGQAQLTQYNRAVDAAIWGIPILSVYSMRQAYFRDAGAKYGNIVYWSKPLDWKAQIPTHAIAIRLALCFFTTKDGPMVLEIPPADDAGLFGSILDAWQVPQADIGPAGEDNGKGGKYLLLPPGYKGHTPLGYLPVLFSTFNGFAVLRVIPDDASTAAEQKAIALIKKTRLYPLHHNADSPNMKYIDISGKLFDGITRFDASFYTNLSTILNEETVQARDSTMMAELRKLGIVRGHAFQINEESKILLTNAAREARTRMVSRAIAEGPLHYLDRHWRLPTSVGIQTRFTFEIDGKLDVGARGVSSFIIFGPPKRLGRATSYLVTFEDANDRRLMGSHTYNLHVPAKVPAAQFWGVTVYDVFTASFFRNAPVLNLNSYNPRMKKNKDGSIDIWFGPEAPEDKRDNWIYTAPGRNWYAIFRFYGPQKPFFDKTWKPGDLEKVE